VLPLFEGRILSFDLVASQAYATLRAKARTAGQVIAPADGYIAAIAMTHELTVATRDTQPFIAAGLSVINPFDLP
jgi:toxin FitB